MHVLVVDDSVFVREITCRLLLERGHEVTEAGNGHEAVAQYIERRPDHVLLDITMPEMDGLETLVAVRKMDPTAAVTMVSALGQQQVIIEALASGARNFVVKPITAEKLEKLLQFPLDLTEAS